MVTLIIVVYKSDKNKLNKLLKVIGNRYKLIIVDNSYNYNFTGVKIPNRAKIIRSKNFGNGSGINTALKKCKTKFAIYLDIDVELKKDFIKKFIKYTKKIKDFSILIPNHGKFSKKNKLVNNYIGEASVMLYNIKKVKNLGIFDINYFLYFEETDLLLRSKRKKSNTYLIPNLSIRHQRASSIVEDEGINLLRSWHYMWSMFYFYKKNYNYFEALKKVSKFIIKDILMLLFYIIILDKKNYKKRFYRLFGVISSMIGLKSFLRP